MRKWLLRFHLYGGLLCAPYLLIFGFSSLHFNHHFGFVTAAPNERRWEAPLSLEPVEDKAAMADRVRDALGLMGWPLTWKISRDAAGDLAFDLERPGKSYTIQTVLAKHKAIVTERHKGFWQVVNSLHALEGLPNSAFLSWWGRYTELCTWFVLFAALSGLYLWANSRRERRIGLVTVLVGAALSLAFIGFVLLRG